ncbi:hypothetical protein HUJ05_004196 [Dendroctonus ponderosae]|nr:hypothetical protein HUJ05_004196 [Dendroctonus ponderosae]
MSRGPLPDSSSSPPVNMQYGYNTGDLSEDEVTDLPSCAFASRSINSNLQHHYLTNLHHNAEVVCFNAYTVLIRTVQFCGRTERELKIDLKD